jgi:adenylate cyclase
MTMTSPWASVIGALRPALASRDESLVAALPDRVKAIIDDQDRATERVIVAVHLVIGAGLLALYALSPRPDDTHAGMLAPVPIALGLYLSFSLIRLALAAKGRLPGWFVAVSIVADFALLFGLIWSFHVQYREPPAFSLKAPAIAYAFVFIALRSLRFNPRYVLAAGLSAAFGWAILTFAAVVASNEGTITHSFSAYINSNRILIGAEIEKIVALLLVTGVLALGVRRAQITLVTAVREETAGKEIRRFLSRGLGDAIAGAEFQVDPGTATERDAAILMLDIRGFTKFAAKVPPRDVVVMLTGFHARIIPIIRDNNGVVDKFLGDGVMATFGAITPSATAAADALRALDMILVESGRWQDEHLRLGLKEPLRVNAAVTAGPVVFAAVGNDDRLEYTVIGEAVNLAAKLEKHNKTEASLALYPIETHAAAVAQGYQSEMPAVARPNVHVAGVPAPIDLLARF